MIARAGISDSRDNNDTLGVEAFATESEELGEDMDIDDEGADLGSFELDTFLAE